MDRPRRGTPDNDDKTGFEKSAENDIIMIMITIMIMIMIMVMIMSMISKRTLCNGVQMG